MMNFTKSQQNAIEMTRRDALIAAAAGSGKTATLTERVIRCVCDKDGDISRLLIVTFTEKAAEELKIRIRSKLEEKALAEPDNARIKRQLSLLPSASICTIHSFCIRLIKEGFSVLGLPPKLRAADEGATEIMRHRILNDIIDGYYNEKKNDGYDIDEPDEFFDVFEKIRPGEKLYEIFRELYNTVTSYPEFIDFYKRCADECEKSADDFENSTQFKYFLYKTKKRFCSILSDFERLFNEYDEDPDFYAKYRPQAEYCVGMINGAIRALDRGNYDELYKLFAEKPSVPSNKPVRDSRDFKELQKKLKESFLDAWDKAGDYVSYDREKISEFCKKTAWLCDCIYKLLSRFEKEFSEEKLKAGVMDFSDMERYAYRLLCDKDFAEKTAAKYDEIYVDEYQDVNGVQDAIFAAVSKNNRFMVGDVKQSIYSFRGSDPTIFTAYRNTFKPFDAEDNEPSVMFLSDNFRCGKPVIDFTNEVFRTVFGAEDRIPYTKDDELAFGKIAKQREDVPVKIAVFPDGTVEDEAEYAAEQIEYLLKHGKNDDGENIKPSDIAVICEKGHICGSVERVLSAHGLLCVNTADKSFFDAPEVLLVISLLSAVDNPMSDVPLAAAMKSPVFGFTLDELVKIRLHRPDEPLYTALCSYSEDTGDEKCAKFIKELSYLRYRSRSMQTDKFIRLLYRKTSVLSVIYNKKDKGDPKDRRSNLIMLYELARKYEEESFKGLYGFISYCNEMIERGKSFKTASDGAGKITVQTIHGSKGLEYPVCFIMGTGTKFNTEYKRAAVVTNSKVGVGMRIKTPEDTIETGPLYKAVVLKKDDDLVVDRACMFYVAMTRAKKYLYITASNIKPVFAKGYKNFKKEYGCFFDYLTASLDGQGGSYEYNCIYKDDEIKEPSAPYRSEQNKAAFDEQLYKELERISDYEYPYKEAAALPKKAAVSSLYPAYLDADDEVVSLEDDAPAPLILPDYAEKEEDTAAKRGTSTHLFMQFCDFERAKADPRAEAERLVSLGFIREENKALISYDEIEGFFRSPLYRRMTEAKAAGRCFWREYRFNIELDAADFTEDEERKKALSDETLLVQGVIDCFFEEEDGSITVVDYKTDRIRRDDIEEFKQRHKRQLGYYKTAVERISLLPVGKCELYSFCLGASVVL